MDKSELRNSLRGLPPATPDQSNRISDRLFAFMSSRLPGTAAYYRAADSEPDISDLVNRLPGWHWLLPRIESDGSLTWRDARVALEVHRWGIEQPTASGPVTDPIQIDIFLVPGLLFDHLGNRLGRGAGYYDRELAQRRSNSLVIGVAIDDRVVDSVLSEAHDQRMTHLATESGVRETTPTR